MFTTKTFILRSTKGCSYLFINAWSVICGPLFFCYILVLVFLKRRFFVSYRNFLRQIDGIRYRETKRSNSLFVYFGYFVGPKGPPSQLRRPESGTTVNALFCSSTAICVKKFVKNN